MAVLADGCPYMGTLSDLSDNTFVYVSNYLNAQKRRELICPVVFLFLSLSKPINFELFTNGLAHFMLDINDSIYLFILNIILLIFTGIYQQ